MKRSPLKQLLAKVLFHATPVPGYEDYQEQMLNNVLNHLATRHELKIENGVAILGPSNRITGMDMLFQVSRPRPAFARHHYAVMVFNETIDTEVNYEPADVKNIRKLLNGRTPAKVQ